MKALNKTNLVAALGCLMICMQSMAADNLQCGITGGDTGTSRDRDLNLGRLEIINENRSSLKYQFVVWEKESIKTVKPYAQLVRNSLGGHETLKLSNIETNDPLDSSEFDLRINNAAASFYTRLNHSGFSRLYEGNDYRYNQTSIECSRRGLPDFYDRPDKTVVVPFYKCKIQFEDVHASSVELTNVSGDSLLTIVDNSGNTQRLLFRMESSSISMINRDDQLSVPRAHLSVPSFHMTPLIVPGQLTGKETLFGTFKISSLPQASINCK